MATSSRRERVGYCYTPELIRACDALPRIKGRASKVAELIDGYNLCADLVLVRPKSLTLEELANFHSKDYLLAFKALSEAEDPEKIPSDSLEEYGLMYDCPVEPGLFAACSLIAGGSVGLAEAMVAGSVDVGINWCGGWHHAKRFEAAGYCYINDIVLAIQKLRERFERVLYIDLDLHHGDGVEEAFYTTNKVLTFSLHKFSAGFYPGSGDLSDIGEGKGAYHNINVPLKDGISTDQYVSLFQSIYNAVIVKYEPQAIVCQCGADGLASDPMDSFNLSTEAYVNCVRLILSSGLPTLLLGGGGYNYENTARCWTLLTACALHKTISSDIPFIDSFLCYKPDYCIHVSAGNRTSRNRTEELDALLKVIHDNILDIPSPYIDAI